MLGDRTLELIGQVARCMAETGTPWALIGGAALPLRGRIRGTRDLDVLVVSSSPDLLVERMQASGFAHHPRADRHTLDRIELLRFWFPVSVAASVGVDVQVTRDAFLERVVARATPVRLNDLTLPVATPEDLVLLKLLSFRPIDRADAIELVALAGTFDSPYVEGASADLDLVARWKEVQAAAREYVNEG